MLEYIRRFSQSYVVKFLFGVLALSFIIFWGIGDIIRRTFGDDHVAKVGRIKIDIPMFQIAYRQQMERLNDAYAQSPKRAELEKKAPYIVVHQLMDAALVTVVGERYHLNPGDVTLMTALRESPEFRNNKGVYDKNLLTQALRQRRITERQFFEMLKHDVSEKILRMPFEQLSFPPALLLDCVLKADLEQRAVEYVPIIWTTMPMPQKPTEQELQTYFQAHQSEYMVDEVRDFKLAFFDLARVDATVKPTDEDLKIAYARHIEGMTGQDIPSFEEMKEKLLPVAKQELIIEKRQQMLRTIEDALAAGKDLDHVVNQFQGVQVTTSTTNVETSWSAYAQKMKGGVGAHKAKDIIKLAMSTEDARTSSPLDDGKGLIAFVHVTGITPKHVADLKDVAKKVEDAWLVQRRKQMAASLAKDFAEKVSRGEKTLAELAKVYKFPLKRTALFNRDGTDENGNRVDPILNEDLVALAFALPKKKAEFGNVTDGHVVVHVLDQVIGDPRKLSADEMRHIVNVVGKQLSEDLYEQARSYWLEQNKSEINVPVLNHILSGGQVTTALDGAL